MNLPATFQFTQPSDVAELERIAFADRELPNSTYELLHSSAEKFADKTALRFLLHGNADEEGVTYSYNELFARITQTANGLNSLGVGREDTVSVLLPNLPQTHFALWGAEAVGIFNPINPLLDIEHIVAIMNEARTRVLVTLAPFTGVELWEKAEQLIGRVPSLTTILTVDMAKFLPQEMARAMIADRPDYLGQRESCEILDFDDFISGFSGELLDSRRLIAPSDVASYFHTGGTTGTPKIAPHSHENEVAMAWQIASVVDIDPDSVTLCGLPLFHVNAVFVTGLAPWLVGAEVLLATPQGYRNPAVIKNFWALVEKHRVSYFSAVPTILSALLEQDSHRYDLSSLQFCACGAAPLSVELMSQFEARTGLVVIEGYGQTEGCCATSLNPRHGERRIGSVGGRLPYMQLRIVELDSDGNYLRDSETNEAGHIVIKGPTVFSGYTQEEHNRGLWLEDGWFITGDMGRLDADGYLWLTGRSKDLIIRGGHNIDPQVIEEALHKHPAVLAAAAVGKPDARVGELPVAYVQLCDGAKVSAEELIAFATGEICERAAVPKEIFVLDTLPVTAVGKIFKPELRNDIVKRVVLTELIDIPGVERDSVRIKVQSMKNSGQRVTIELAATKTATSLIRDRLNAYAFEYQLC